MRQRLSWILLLVALFSSATSFAQNKEEVRKVFGIASAFYEAEKYEEAIPYYQEAYDLSKEAIILFNIGQCYRLLGNPAKALEFYERFLQEAKPDNDPDRQEQARGFIEELRPLVIVPVVVDPPTTKPLEQAPPEASPNTNQRIYIALGAGAALGASALTYKLLIAPRLITPRVETRGEKRLELLLGASSDIAFITAGVFFLTRPKRAPEAVSLSVGLARLSAQVSF